MPRTRRPRQAEALVVTEPVHQEPAPPVPAPVREPTSVKARMANAVIRVTTPAGIDNPYKPGTAAHLHFERMKGGITILEYLAKFPQEEHRKARQWLYNATKAGFVRTLGG